MSNYLGIDVGGTFIKYALINGSGQIIESNKVSTPNNESAFLTSINQLIDLYKEQIKAVTISSPGKVDTKEGIIHYGGALAFLDGLRLKEHISKEFQLPSAIINDGKAAALAEVWLGGLKGIEHGVCLTLGTGIGGGLVVNGKLLEGAHFQAGEISFGVGSYDKTGIQAVVAEKGSAVGFVTQASQVLGLEDKLDGIKVFEELEKKNELIYPLFQEFCQQIAVVIINIQSVLDMEKVVIGGGMSVQPLLIKEITEQYQALRHSLPMMENSLVEVRIESCQFKNNANLLGSLYHYLLMIENENN